nr:hypothetical protein [Erwinia sp. S38]
MGKDRYGQSLGWSAPLVIMADYQGGLSKRLGDIGFEQVVKNTFWTEYAEAKAGDYILIGESDNSDPIAAGADEVMQSIQYADTFERTTDDWAILTGV